MKLAVNFTERSQKLHSSIPAELFQNVDLFEDKIVFFFHFQALDGKYFGQYAKILGHSSLHCLLDRPEEHSGKFFVLELMFFFISGHLAKMLNTFVYFFFCRWGCHNCIQCVQSNTLKKIFIFDRKIFISFGHWAEKFRKFSWFLYEVVRTPFCMSKGTFWARECS